MADLDKLRALLSLLREFGVEKFEDDVFTLVLSAPATAPPKVERQQPEDPAVATVRRLQETLGKANLG